jgi:hypothetical protein
VTSVDIDLGELEMVPMSSLDVDRAEPTADATGPRLFTTTSSADLLEPDEPMHWLLRGLLCDPTYGQLAGEMKTLKSYLSTFLAIAVATGERLFDRFAVDRARPVLMYVGEGGSLPHKKRLRRIAHAMGVDLGDLASELHRSYDVAAVDSIEYQASLARDLERIEPGLFVLDPLYAYHGANADARNLHEEGAHLGNAVHLARQAGATALIVNHFNQTGAGRGLSRITQAGSGEWVDSWLLLAHREAPDVRGGRFQLALDVGSRQWGGATWDLDLNIGRFDPDTGTHDGEISWDLRAAGTSTDTPAARITAAVTQQPGELTKEQAAKAAGGNVVAARHLVDQLADQGVIEARLVQGKRSDGRSTKTWRYFPGSAVGAAEPSLHDLVQRPGQTTHEHGTSSQTTHDDTRSQQP